MAKVGWSITHQEFTITDYYYFSILKREAKKTGIEIDEVDKWEKLKDYEIIVFNYPEKPFTEREVEDVEKWIREYGKKVILLGYYKNQDGIADTCNTLARRFGMELNSDEITDEINNYQGDKYFIVTSQIKKYTKNEKGEVVVNKILLPCTASIKPLTPDIEVVVQAENTAISDQGNSALLIAEQIVPASGGCFCLAGTCVFWDNYSINLFDNLAFSLNLLKHKNFQNI